jgi:uncharacterized membrane protein YfcA
MTELLVLSVGVFLGAVVSAFSGFAFSAAAGAILLHAYDPLTAIPIMMACSIASQTITLVALRRSLHFANAVPLLTGGAAGVVLAMQVIRWMDPATLKLTFGLFLVVYGGTLILRDQRRRIETAGRSHELAAGALGGVVGVFTAMPGAIPTLWCELRGFSKEQQRGLVQPFILAMQVFALALLALTSGVPPAVPGRFLLALPVLIAGSWIGLVAFRRVDDRLFRRAVLVLLIASGLALMR